MGQGDLLLSIQHNPFTGLPQDKHFSGGFRSNEATYSWSFEVGDVVLHDNNTAQNKQRQPMAAFVFNRGDAFMSARYRFGLEIKFDALGQGKVRTVVDGVGLAAHVRFPSVRTGFPAPTCFLLTTKRATNLSP